MGATLMYLQNIILKEKQNIHHSNNKSYYIYKYAILVLFIPSIILIPFGPKTVFSYLDYILVFITPLLFTAFLIDIYFIIKLLWGTIYSKILYSIIGYFAYIKATVYAKKIIFINTSVNPDVFQSSINYIAGWLVIPAWIIQINIILSILIFILAFLPQILFIFKDFAKPLFNTIEYQIKIPLNKYIGKNIFFHLFYFIIGSSIFNYYAIKIPYKIYDYSNYNIIKEKIKDNSYYLNNYHFTCNNKEILPNDYIKVIGDNIVSIARKDYKGNITFYKKTCNKL
jgi:hypothetical protein